MDQQRKPLPTYVGLCGYARAGKDTVAQILKELYGYEQVAFADKLRDFALALDGYLPELGTTYGKLIKEHGYEGAKKLHPCVREYLVRIGHLGRQHIYESIWIDAALLHGVKTGTRLVVVSDVRYANEADRIHQLGGVVWRIDRPGVGAANATEAESIPRVPCEAVIRNDGTIDELREQVSHRLKGSQ